MHSKAVDLPKHGDLIDVGKFNSIQRRNRGFVDFICYNKKSKWKKIKESAGVLGKMFRDAHEEFDQVDLMELEFKFKIQRDYSLPDDLFQNTGYLDHLEFVYLNIVNPYNIEIKNLMHDKFLLTESDVFDANWQFTKISLSQNEKYSYRQQTEMILSKIQSEYKRVKWDYISKVGHEDNIHKAIYFACYFDSKHLEDPKVKALSSNDGFIRFMKLYNRNEWVADRLTLEQFKRILSSDRLEIDKFNRLLAQTKILSLFWMVS